MIPDIRPASLRAIRNSTKPATNDDIHARVSADDTEATQVAHREESDDSYFPSMVEREPCRVLVVVAGSDSDVVGATLAAFLGRDRERVDELHVLAPVRTGGDLRSSLLRAPNGADPLADILRRLNIARSEILFGGRTIHVLGNPGDASPPGAAADDALEVLRGLCTGNNEVAVVASTDAGALGVLAYAALQFVGRSKDRFFFLDHESGRTHDTTTTIGRGKPHVRRLDPLRKRGTLSELPTVLAVQPLEGGQTFQGLAESRRLARQRLSEPGILFLNGKQRTIRIDDIEFTMPRLQFFWFFALASLAPRAFPLKTLTGNFRVDAHTPIAITAAAPERAALEATVASLKRIFVALFPNSVEDFALMFMRACGPSPGLPSIVAKINARLKEVLGIGATPYLIAGGRSAEGYRLALAPGRLKMELPASSVQGRH